MWLPAYPFMASCEQLWSRPLPWALGKLIQADTAVTRTKEEATFPLQSCLVLWAKWEMRQVK